MKKKIVNILIWMLVVLSVIVIPLVVSKIYNNGLCKDVNISINYNSETHFITEQDINNYLIGLGNTLKGKKLSTINVESVEKVLRDNEYVKEAVVFTSVDRSVSINIIQRNPLVRVQNSINENFYISDDGKMMRCQAGKPARVLVANGRIFELFWPSTNLNIDSTSTKKDSVVCNTALYKIYLISKYINNDNFLRAQIEQLYVSSPHEILLIPKVGDHVIKFGDSDDLKEKFDKLVVFYKQGISQDGWNNYDTINLMFKNQVVCSKKI
jgi:cell division protein FtsQ